MQFTLCFLLFICFSATAQFHNKEVTSKAYTLNVEKTQPKQSWLASQRQHFNQPPILTSRAAIPFTNKSSYWLGQVTTQSMHEGKMGTFYMWDQQGNLQESRFFMDIGGSRMPGLKLVFPRR